MELVGKTFLDKQTNNSVKIERVNDNIVQLSNGSRVAIERILDKNFYTSVGNGNNTNNLFTESIDIDSFSTPSNILSGVSAQLKNIDTTNIVDTPQMTKIEMDIPVVENHRDAVKTDNVNVNSSLGGYDELELEKRKREMIANNKKLAQGDVNIGLEEYMDDIPKPIINRNLEGVINAPTVPHTPKRVVELQDQNDPVYQMFKSVKRSTRFSMSVKIDEKIPTKEFIKMWEDNYDKSIIDFLVDEFTEKLLTDPAKLKEQIRKSIKEKVYPKKPRRKATVVKK